MGLLDRQLAAYVGAVLVAACGTLMLGADAAVPSLAGGALLCALAVAAGGAAPLPLAFWLGAATLAWLAATTLLSGGGALAAPELGAMAGIAGAFAVGVQAGHVPARAKRAGGIAVTALLALAAAAFLAHVTSPDALLGRPKPYHEGRLTGTFLSANTAATLAALGLVLGLSGVRRAAAGTGSALRALDAIGRHGIAPAALALLAGTCLSLTGSRGGVAAGLLGGVLVLVPANGLRGRRLPLILAAAASLIVLFSASGGVLGDRFADVGVEGSGRTALWRASLAAWADAPWLGHGPGSFARALAPHVAAETAPLLSVQGAAHNVMLQWLVQTGVVGTVLGGATLASALHLLLQGAATRRRGRWLIRAALAGLAVFVLHGLVDYAFEVPAATWWLALLTGLGAGVAGGERAVTERRAARRST